MKYIIKHNTPEELKALPARYPQSEFPLEWDLLDTEGKETLTLGAYETEEQARFALLFWQTIDFIQGRYETFCDELAEEIKVPPSVIEHYMGEFTGRNYD